MSPVIQAEQRLTQLKALHARIGQEIADLEAAATRRGQLERPVKPKRSRRSRGFGTPGAIREWAVNQGLAIGERGRVSTTIREAYLAAHPQEGI